MGCVSSKELDEKENSVPDVPRHVGRVPSIVEIAVNELSPKDKVELSESGSLQSLAQSESDDCIDGKILYTFICSYLHSHSIILYFLCILHLCLCTYLSMIIKEQRVMFQT